MYFSVLCSNCNLLHHMAAHFTERQLHVPGIMLQTNVALNRCIWYLLLFDSLYIIIIIICYLLQHILLGQLLVHVTVSC